MRKAPILLKHRQERMAVKLPLSIARNEKERHGTNIQQEELRSNYLRWWTEHIALRNGADNVRLMLPRSVSKVSTGCSKVSLPVRCVMALPS